MPRFSPGPAVCILLSAIIPLQEKIGHEPTRRPHEADGVRRVLAISGHPVHCSADLLRGTSAASLGVIRRIPSSGRTNLA